MPTSIVIAFFLLAITSSWFAGYLAGKSANMDNEIQRTKDRIEYLESYERRLSGEEETTG